MPYQRILGLFSPLNLILSCLVLSSCLNKHAPPPEEEAAHYWLAGPFRIIWKSTELQIQRQQNGRWHRLLSPLPGQSLLLASQGAFSAHEQRGSYQLSFPAQISCQAFKLSLASSAQAQLKLHGQFIHSHQDQRPCQGSFSWEFEFRDQRLQSRIQATQAATLSLQFEQNPQAWYRGLGVQPSQLDLKGQKFSLLSQEAGIGRGAQPLSTLINLISPGSAGSAGSSYFPLPHFWSSELWALGLNSSLPAEADFSQRDRIRLTQLGSELSFWLEQAETPLALLSRISTHQGRQPLLPDWIHQGVVLGLQGGTERVRAIWQQLQAAGVPIAALWLQDWVGKRQTAIGSQLWWNWELDQLHYPNWQSFRQELAQHNIRLLGYINPFLVDVSSRPHQHNFYAEAKARNYLIKNAQGEIYQLQNTDFSAGMLDLSKPAAVSWFRQLIEQQLIQQAGFSGWMADYGEALPLDAHLASGENGLSQHNRYPLLWARLQASASQPEGVWFLRSGYLGSPAFAPLFWLGDQTVDWSPEDGLHSALKGLISGGLSGITVNHSDSGGYTSVSQLGLTRSQELLARWLELNTFSALLRSHEGNQPEANAQVYDPQMLSHFARQARIFGLLFALRKQLLLQAHQQGWPLVRHPALHYPQDPQIQALDDQFMFGPEFMIAPVLHPGQQQRRLYLPAGKWIHLWSGQTFESTHGHWLKVPAPLGQMPVFYLADSAFGQQLRRQLAEQGLLEL